MTAQSNVNSSIDCAVSLQSKLDTILNIVSGLDSRLSSIENRLSNLEGKIDNFESVLNNTIDSIENLIISLSRDLTSIINNFIELLKSLLGNRGSDRTDEILAAIQSAKNELGVAIVDAAQLVKRAVDNSRDEILSAISMCCSEIINLIKRLNNDDIADKIIGAIKESIGGAENRLTGEINQNETKLNTIIDKLNKIDDPDWINRILSAIAALAALFKDNSCDLEQIFAVVNSWGRLLEALIKNINCDSEGIKVAIDLSKNYLATKIDGNTNILNSVDNRTSSVLNVANNTYNNTTSILNNVSNFNSQVDNIVNNIQNTSNYNQENITNNINNSTSQITNLIQNCIDSGDGTPGAEIEYKFAQVRVFARCNPDTNEPEFDLATIKVQKELEAQEVLKFDRIAEIEGKQCKIPEPIALIPEWWQVRLEGGTPQFVLAFGEVDEETGKCTHAKYPMTIPHLVNVKPIPCPFPRYRKGNYELIAYFKDNSKLIINAFNEYECQRVFDAILPWIDQEYAESVKYKVGKRVSYPFKEIWVCPKFGKYFSQGNRDTNPDWTVYYN
jgi:hypothetical protein